ncbi:MAG: hypothetical protein U5K54_13820 [Cytophagales bacterium]|nr:hypothetical protein [Cytophagales bacterium]
MELGSFRSATIPYGAPGLSNAIALDTLISLAGLKPRSLSPSEILKQRQEEIVKLLPAWSEESLNIFAENFFMDESLERRKIATQKMFEEVGSILSVNELLAENQLRGSFLILGEKKNLGVFFTLTPEPQALIQQLDLELVDK